MDAIKLIHKRIAELELKKIREYEDAEFNQKRYENILFALDFNIRLFKGITGLPEIPKVIQ